MIISIAGNAGSGKSTVAKKIAEKLGWPHYYIGALRREKATRLGLTLEEYNKLGENDPKTDVEVDEYQKELAQEKDTFIIEGRTSWYFIPQSFKIFIDVDEKIGAAHIMAALKDNSRNETRTKIASIEEMLEKNRQRKQSDIRRFQKYYGIDAYDKNHFDLVIDTTKLSQEETFERVYQAILAKIGKKN